MSCDNFQHRFPPEGTMKLYRGLVRDGEKRSNHSNLKSSSFNAALYERERMRVLEILGLLDTDKNNSKQASLRKPVDKPSYHLGSNARKRKMVNNKDKSSHLKASKQPSPQRKNIMTNKNNPEQFEKIRRIYESTERKKPKQSKNNNQTSKSSKSTRFNPILCKDYVWHPIKIKDSSGQGQKEGQRTRSQAKDVLSYYHNQYHKQNKK